MGKQHIKRIFTSIFITLALFTHQLTASAKSQHPINTNGTLKQQTATLTLSLPEQTTGRPPLSLTLALLGMCCIFGLVIGVFVLGFVVRTENKKDWEKKNKADATKPD